MDYSNLSALVVDDFSTMRRIVGKLLKQTGFGRLDADNGGANLAGPQVPDKALQQNDVDELLASLGF